MPPSPKPRYRSNDRYHGFDDLSDENLETLSPFQVAVRIFDYSHLEPLLAAHIYVASAKGQVPFHPVSMYLLSLYRRERNLSRNEVLRILRHLQDGQTLRHCAGFEDDLPSESGLRHFEKQLTPELQQEINALQIDILYQAGLLPIKPGGEEKAILSFDGMLHQARSRMRCSSVKANCYEAAPRPCPAKKTGKQGCNCDDTAYADVCRHAIPLDPAARLVIYTGNNKRAQTSPNTPLEKPDRRSRISRMVYGYYSYAGQLLDDDLATYWILPAAFGSATDKDSALFPTNFAYLQARFPWLKVGEVIADAGACEQTCLDAIWDAAGALRMVDICLNKADKNPDTRLERGYDENGHPLCPFGYVLHANGYDYQRRRSKWRCAKRCRRNSKKPVPECPYLKAKYKHGYTVAIGRAHSDGTVRLAREIPYGSPAWKERYGRRNSAESRNSVLERLDLKRMPVHGQNACHVTVLQGDFGQPAHPGAPYPRSDCQLASTTAALSRLPLSVWLLSGVLSPAPNPRFCPHPTLLNP